MDELNIFQPSVYILDLLSLLQQLYRPTLFPNELWLQLFLHLSLKLCKQNVSTNQIQQVNRVLVL